MVAIGSRCVAYGRGGDGRAGFWSAEAAVSDEEGALEAGGVVTRKGRG